MNKILLVDVDSKIPNLALMKLSTYYKNLGYNIILNRLSLTYYPNKNKERIIDGKGFEKVFVSTIYRINKNKIKVINCNEVQFGGVGHELTKKLPKEIDDLDEDYSIYPENDKSYGFITRGCIRNCYFCVVPKKEGKIYKYRNIDQIVKHKEVILMDNNILAFKNHKKILKELIDKKIRCQFNQGLDIRLIDDENAELLSKLRYIGNYIFAFDDLRLEKIIEEKLKILKKYIKSDWRIKMFLYCHPRMQLKDIVYRVNWCKRNRVLPYLMRDELCWSSEFHNFYTDLTSWCNQPGLFKNMTFNQFMQKRTNNLSRRNKSIGLYNKYEQNKNRN